MKAAQKTKDEFLRLDTLRSELLRDLAVMAEQELSGIQLGTVDELTGFSNRRGFMALPQPTLNSCKRRSLSTCMFYFGLDQFKQINDRYGHAEGDRALVAFGKLLLDTFRESDVIGRIGGDEFTVLFSGAGNAKPMEILARFSKAVFDYNERGNRGYDITYSVGLSESGVEWISLIVDLLRAADAQMNRQKLYK